MGAANACGQVQHQKVNDAVGGADPDANKVNDHLEQTVQNRVHQPQRRSCKQEGKFQRLGHAHQTGGKGSRDDLCLGGGLLLLFGGGDKSHCHADHAEGLHQTVGQKTCGIPHHCHAGVTEQGKEHRLCANDLLTADDHAVAQCGVEEGRPDQMMQTRGDQHAVQETVQEHAERACTCHDTGQGVDTRRSHRPDVAGNHRHDQNDGQQHHKDELAVAVHGHGAFKLGVDEAVVNQRHHHAKDHAQKYAHVGNVIAEADGLTGAVQSACRITGDGQSCHIQPAGIGCQPDQIADQCQKCRICLALFGKAHCDAHAEQDTQIANDCANAAIDEFAEGPDNTALCHQCRVAHDRRNRLQHTRNGQEQNRTHQSFGKALHRIHNFLFHWCSPNVP